ncbi:MAG: hypothetical protein RLZZ118_1348 [Bacteroidota bacterium]|jgi:hypothetical protein
MYIYNVTIKIENSIQDAWLAWMQKTHIPEVLATGKFQDARFSQLVEPITEGDDGLTYVVQYFADTYEDYTSYIDEHAPILRDKGFKEFGNQFIAFRSLLKSL